MTVLNTLTISDKVVKRPDSKETHFIPDPVFSEFWEDLYFELRNSKKLRFPLDDTSSRINPFFGYFGFRFHPIKFKADYFHIGIDIDQEIGQKIYPVSDGIFEYSGYGKENGKYVMLSHPNYQTKDGFIMHSLYLHLDRATISFNSFEKILRTAGLIKLTDKKITLNQVIGFSGDSGNSKDIFPHLHLQIEFRNKSQDKIILIDPAKLLGLPTGENATKNIKGFSDFKIFYTNNKKDLANWLPLIDKYEHDNYTT